MIDEKKKNPSVCTRDAVVTYFLDDVLDRHKKTRLVNIL